MSVVDWASGHRRSIIFLLLVLSIGGALTAMILPVALFPNVNFPRIVVNVDSGDRPAEQMVISVTRPAEQAVRSVPGLHSIRSTTSRGSAELSINFNWGQDMALALLQVELAINRIRPNMPRGTVVSARRMDSTVFPVTAYSLTSKDHTLVELRDIAEFQLTPILSAIDGVARIGVLGGKTAEYKVKVDLAHLEAYGLKIQDVVQALSASNVLKVVGRMEDHYKLFLVLSDTSLRSIAEVRRTILRSGDNGLVELEDVATVEPSTVPQWQKITANGQEAVLLQIYQQPAGNTVQIVNAIKTDLARFKKNLPKGITIRNWYDQSQLITESSASVRDTIIVGMGLAAVVLFIFLRNLRVTFLAVITVPVVLASTILFLYMLGMTFNIMTLGGMAAAVGLILDDATIMIEHIVRRLRAGTDDVQELIRQAAREFATPLIGSSSSTVIVFLPLAFLGGVTGAFFKPLSLTMVCALVISFFVAWFAIPILASHLIGKRETEIEDIGKITHWFHSGYRYLMNSILLRPWVLLVGVVPFLLVGYLGYRNVGSGFMPAMDEGGFVIDYRTTPGTSLDETDRLVRQLENILRATREVVSYSRRTGAQLGGGITESNSGDLFVRLKPPPRNSIEEIMNHLRHEIEERIPGLKVEMAQLMEDLIGDLTAVPQPIEIKLYGDDPKILMKSATDVAERIGHIPGVVDVRNGIVLAGDALEIQVDRDRAALENMDPEMITMQLRTYLTGLVATEVQKKEKLIGIRVWVPRGLRSTTDDFSQLKLQAADGHWLPLKRVALVKIVSGQPQINRDNLKRMLAVTGRISGRDMGSTVNDVQQVLSKAELIPSGVYYELGGLYRQQRIAFRGLIMVFAAAVVLVFLLLLFLYERFRVSITIMGMPLLAISAVFIGLWVTGTELNITSMMGMTMVVGIVTEVAIFYFSEYQDLRTSGTNALDALVEAGINRMRPIAMTTFAAIVALLPLALGIGQGAAMQKPLAIAIISGLIVQIPLILVVMPILFHRVLDRSGSSFTNQASDD